MPAGTVKRKVLGVDRYSWSVPTADPNARQRHTAKRGEIIEISRDEAKRGESIIDITSGLAALADPDAEVPAEVLEERFSPLTDEAITGLTVDQVMAYLAQVPEHLHDEERDRVVDLERLRDEDDQRVTILALDPEYQSADPDDAAAQPDA